MAATAHGSALFEAVVYLAAALVCVPLFARLKIGAIIGYLAAGLLIGPYVLGMVADTGAVTGLAELGVVMVMFVIGLSCVRRASGPCERTSSASARRRWR
ncbi:transporter [Hankyongella ginsenosidimutans]|uniref:Transporter n=1 Tax=Hankyongella ginsenosidimutans TaxID=1763828 RepID=A0A4D7C958_9SPHN|nr:cation:proton antiporter [Hankyongella ginsenosidimutans]QCI79353.1 transporter [Hankyongella ginsenosidimutans]